MNTISYRNLIFTHNDLVEGDCTTQHAMAGESLACDTLDFTVWCPIDPELDDQFITSDGDLFEASNAGDFLCLAPTPLTDFVPGEPLMYYLDDNLINRFYLSDVKRAGRGLYHFSCVSAIGLLEQSYHFGGIYAGEPITAVLSELFEGLSYEVDPVVESIKLYGWLPYDTKRNNLQQITIATALSIRTKADGTVKITALTSEVKGIFEADRAVLGGEVTVKTPCTAVQVTEHSFLAATEDITLCDESFATQQLVVFSEPAHSLSITGGSILMSGANYAVIQGAGAVLLKGKKYIHTIKRVTKGSISGNTKDNILTVANATLITSLNSSAVAEKLYEVLSLPSVISQDVLYGNERPGDVVSVINPYTGVLESACAKRLAITFGGITKAAGEFLVDYTPSGVITGYQNKIVISSNGNFTVPEGVTKLRAVLIGGGQGGQAGFNGLPGTNGSRLPSGWTPTGEWYMEGYNGEGGNGGTGGVGGHGGNVLDTGELTVIPGEDFSVSLGVGGKGGNTNGAPGSDGSDTIFGAFSTANGAVLETGYIDLMEGNVFGICGCDAPNGAKGRGKTNHTKDRTVYFNKQGFENIACLNGNQGASSWELISAYVFGIGGSGGGAAWGNLLATRNGSDGAAGSADYNNGHGFADGGDGGRGGDGSSTPAQTIRGSGGHGGSGGGGGGGGGAYANFYGGSSYEWPGGGGIPGNGAKGGDGSDGLVIIYY